jgi:hypothetical protein
VLLLNECLLLLLISLSTQSGNFWIQPRIQARTTCEYCSGALLGDGDFKAVLVTTPEPVLAILSRKVHHLVGFLFNLVSGVAVAVSDLNVKLSPATNTAVLSLPRTRVYPKVSGLNHNEINNNNKHSFRSNTKGHGGKTHYTDSQNSGTTASSGREMHHLQFSLQAASPETFGYNLVCERVRAYFYDGRLKSS